jgi:hypothetical protein
MTTQKKSEVNEGELVYYTHPDGKMQEMTRAEASELEKEQGGTIRSEAELVCPTGAPKR